MKIPPVFKITPKIVNFTASIENNSAILRNKKIPAVRLEKIVRESLLKSGLYSAKIEGNRLELKEAHKLTHKQKEHIEIQNIIRALKYIKRNIDPRQRITPKFIKRLHFIIMNKLSWDAGNFRTKQNAIFNQEGFAVFMPPSPTESAILLRRLIKYINSEKHEETPLIKANLVHLIFEKIHPFMDGNGRVGRLLIHVVLRLLNYEFPKIVSFEEKLNDEKEDYYYYLGASNNNATEYLEFMFGVIDEAVKQVCQKNSSKNKEGDGTLLPRRQEILEIIRDHRIVSVDFLARRFQNISGRTIRNDLEDLAKLGLVIKVGSTRGTVYKII